MNDSYIPCDFFESDFGGFKLRHLYKRRRFGWYLDRIFDARMSLSGWDRRMEEKVEDLPIQRVLVMGVDVPKRSADLAGVMGKLESARHEVTRVAVPMLEGLGKFQNINRALSQLDVEKYDWLVVTDDDIAFEPGFLDRYLYLVDRFGLALSMPAHNFRSYQSYLLTQRHWNSLARETRFVECGPINFIHRSLFKDLLPFPELRWAWATDLWWSERSLKLGVPIGIVDATPISHLRPVGRSYDKLAASDESKAFILQEKLEGKRVEILSTVRRHSLGEI